MLALLKLRENARIPEESFLEEYNLSEVKTLQELGEASRLGLVQRIDGCLQISRAERLKLVVRCLEEGLDVERVCKAAGWREFEDLVAMILGDDGYVTKKHLRFRSDGRGYEVDVLGLKTPWSLVVECKRWKRSWQPSALRRVADAHRRRVSALADVFPAILNRLGHSAYHEVTLVPVVLTLSETPMRMEEGMPFVPIIKFQGFLGEFAGYIEDLAAFTCSAGIGVEG